MAMIAEVWGWIPWGLDGRMEPTAAEVLYEARPLARRIGAELVAITDREPDGDSAAWLAARGVKRRRVLDAPLAPHPVIAAGRHPLAGLDAADPPRAFLLPANTAGRVVAPLWAAASGAVLITGAAGVTADTANYVAARPTHGERLEALVTVPLERPLVVTLLPGAVGGWEAPAGESAPPPEPGAAIYPPDPATLDLADAERIVAFGRGAFHADAIALVERLAVALGAVVAGTRPAADEGWLPFARQVGLTGAVVSPKLYVAVGISGAPYHMVGLKGVEHLVAINQDAEAPILEHANLSIVGDLYQVLPRLIEAVQAMDTAAGLPAALAAGRE